MGLLLAPFMPRKPLDSRRAERNFYDYRPCSTTGTPAHNRRAACAKSSEYTIDDFGLMELDLDKCRDLFEVIDGRDGRKSTIIISQFPIKSWFDLFREHTYADACLARITDKRHSYRLEMNGISMREAEK